MWRERKSDTEWRELKADGCKGRNKMPEMHRKFRRSLSQLLYLLQRKRTQPIDHEELHLTSPVHLLIVCIYVTMHIYTHYVHSGVHCCMYELELEALHLGPGTSYVLIIPVSIKPDYFPKARMHDSSVLIDQCLWCKCVCVCFYASEWVSKKK